MPESDGALLADAVLAAGAVALRYWRNSPKSWEKPDGTGPVTEADIAVNDLMADRLHRARPTYGWLSEETPDSPARLGTTACFILDPIDGTRAFMAGEAHFAVSLAVAQAGRITAAAIYLPALDLLYSATAGGAALRNGHPIRCSASNLPGATLLCSRPVLAAENWQSPPPVTRHFRASLAYRICLVAEGAFDAMLTLRPTWEWDVAAGALIAECAGAMVTDRRGLVPGFNRAEPLLDGMIVAGGAVHQGLAGLLAQPAP